MNSNYSLFEEGWTRALMKASFSTSYSSRLCLTFGPILLLNFWLLKHKCRWTGTTTFQKVLRNFTLTSSQNGVSLLIYGFISGHFKLWCCLLLSVKKKLFCLFNPKTKASIISSNHYTKSYQIGMQNWKSLNFDSSADFILTLMIMLL